MSNGLMYPGLQGWTFMLVGTLLVLVLYRCRLLQRSAFKAAPQRRVNLHAEDMIIGFGVFLLSSAVVAKFMSSVTQAGVDDPSAFAYARSVLWGQMSMLPLVAFVIWKVTRRSTGLVSFGFKSRHPVYHVGLGLLALILAMPIVLGTGEIIRIISVLIGQPPPKVAHDMLKVVESAQSPAAIMMLFIPAVILAPVLEEVIYRGLVQTALLDLIGPRRRWWVILIASLLFTIVHTSVAWQGKPILYVLALFLGWLYERTGCLWPSTMLHVGFNATNFAWVVLMRSG